MAGKIRVLLVDDNEELVAALMLRFRDQTDMECIAGIGNADRLTETLAELKPDIVLLDLTMPGRNSLEAMAEASG